MSCELRITDTLISTVATGSPLIAPLTLAYVKQHIRALGTADDTLTAVRILAAGSFFEEQTGRQLLTATREAWLDAFPFVGASGGNARIELPKPPLQSVVSVKYIDSGGILQSFQGGSPLADLFAISKPAGPYAARGWVEPLYGGVWPTARAQTGAVRIQYTCGYGDTAAAIPDLVKSALCYLVAVFDQFPVPVQSGGAAEIPYGIRALLDPFKYSALPTQLLRTSALPIAAPPNWWSV